MEEDTSYALNVKREQKVEIMNRRVWRRSKIPTLKSIAPARAERLQLKLIECQILEPFSKLEGT